MIEVQASVSAIDGVVFVGIETEFELLARLLQSRYHIHRILNMDIVIASAVYEEIIALEPVGEVEGRVVVVALGVVFGKGEETLGIDVVVVAPSDDGSDGDGGLEDIVAFEYGERREVAAEAPTPDADTLFVDPALLTEPAGSFDSILTFHTAEVLVGLLLEVGSTTACAATVEAEDHIALAGEHVVPVVVGVAVGVGYLLVARTTIDVDEDGIFFILVEVGGSDGVAVEAGAARGGEGAELLVASAVVFHLSLQGGVVDESLDQLALSVEERIDGSRVGVAVNGNIVFAAVAESSAIGAQATMIQTLFLLAVEAYLVEVGIDGVALLRGVVDGVVLRVHATDGLHLPVAGGYLADELSCDHGNTIFYTILSKKCYYLGHCDTVFSNLWA